MTDIREMDIDQIRKFKSRLESTLELVNERIDNYTLSECSVCGDYQLAYQGLPPGWAWQKNVKDSILCAKCIIRWTERFGEAPNVHREGDEL